MFIPETAINLKTNPFQQLRFAFMGAPASGKTHAALSFPNPVVADLDNKLGAHLGKDVVVLPFYDEDWVVNVLKVPKTSILAHANRKDAFLKFLKGDAKKLEADQTLIIDSFSNLELGFDQQQGMDKSYATGSGKEDKFVFWAKKQEYYGDVCTLIKSLKCNVIGTFHEQFERNDDGDLISKLKPVMSGGFKDKILGHFTEIFRQINRAKKSTEGKVIGTEYLWQIKSDNLFNCSVTVPKLINDPRTHVEADYKSLI